MGVLLALFRIVAAANEVDKADTASSVEIAIKALIYRE
jgi:hypothetical protein